MRDGWAVQALRLVALSLLVWPRWAAGEPEGDQIPGEAQGPNFENEVVKAGDRNSGSDWFYMRQSDLDRQYGYSQGFSMDGPQSFREARGVALVARNDLNAPQRNADLVGGSLLGDSYGEMEHFNFNTEQWVYRVRASPNMVELGYSPSVYTTMAVGGVLWSQVHSFGLMRNGSATQWYVNREYDPRWERVGGRQDSDQFPPVDQSIRSPVRLSNPDGFASLEDARRFMEYITWANEWENRSDVPPSTETVMLRRALLDWDLVSEPARTFPLFRPFPTIVDGLTPLQTRVAVGEWLRGMTFHAWLRVPTDFFNDAARGILTVAECAIAARLIGPQLLRHRTGKGKRAVGPAEPADSCSALARLLAQSGAETHSPAVPSPGPPCRHIRALQLGFQIPGGTNDGTFDSLVLAFADAERHKIASSPDAGFHQWQDIDMAATFGAANVTLAHLSQLRIFQVNDGSALIANDNWKLQGLTLRARCADSLTELEVDKFQSVNTIVTPPRSPPGHEAQVWSGAIDATADWKTRVHCSSFDKLQVDFELSNAWTSGTFDDILLRFDNQQPSQLVFLLDKESNPGAKSSINIKLQETFGSKLVPFQHINWFDVYSRDHFHKADEWRVKGIKFTARCSGSNQLAYIDKFSNVNQAFERNTPKAHMMRNITLSDWHWNLAQLPKKLREDM